MKKYSSGSPSKDSAISSDCPLPYELLITKLQKPIISERFVARTRLTQQLNLALDRRLTLLIAPPGYGKTALLGEWIASSQNPAGCFAWVSLDAYDNTPLRMWAYITAAIQKIYPELHFQPQSLAPRGYDPQDFNILHPLINEIAQLPFSIVLILDDYQVITNEVVHSSIRYLLEHQPANLHLVIASRSTPPIHLARLRAQQQILEITAQDLAFNFVETSTFLHSMMGSDLSPAQVSTLLDATDGWIVGLQLTALSFQGKSDFSPAQKAIPNQHSIHQYLVEEVFSHINPELQTFFLETSILAEISTPLCDAVRQQTDSQEYLRYIEEKGLFVTCIDDQGTWYRYHPLFAEALQYLLQKFYPEKIPELHRRASTWLLDQGYSEQAITHAMEAGDLEQAAAILDGCIMNSIRKFDMVGIIQWISRFPDQMIKNRPRLGIYYALANYHINRFDISEAELQMVEQALNDQKGSISIECERSLRWQIETIRASINLQTGKTVNIQRNLLDVIHNAPEEDGFFLGFMIHNLARAYASAEQFEDAISAFETGSRFALAHALPSGYIQSRCEIARIRKLQGRLTDSEKEYRCALDYMQQNHQDTERLSLAEIGLLEIEIERNTFKTDPKRLSDIVDKLFRIENKPAFLPVFQASAIFLTNYSLAQSDPEQARVFLEKVKTNLNYPQDGFSSPISEVIRLQTRLWILTGEICSNPCELKNEIDKLAPYNAPRTAKQIALAHIDFAQGKATSVLSSLQDVEISARKSGREEQLLEILILQGLINMAEGRKETAYKAIDEALSLAAPEGYMRIFLVEGSRMKSLLGKYLAYRTESSTRQETRPRDAFARKLISSFDGNREKSAQVFDASQANSALGTRSEGSLSSREMEVLALLAKGKSRKEISTLLMVSENTVKFHIKNINRKLDSHNWAALYQRVIDIRTEE